MGILPTEDALRKARDADLDLVEVAPNERPPVCRIMDFGKYKYDKKKKSGQQTHHTKTKEIRLRPKTGEHDIGFKVKRAIVFLQHKDKVQVSVIFPDARWPTSKRAGASCRASSKNCLSSASWRRRLNSTEDG